MRDPGSWIRPRFVSSGSTGLVRFGGSVRFNSMVRFDFIGSVRRFGSVQFGKLVRLGPVRYGGSIRTAVRGELSKENSGVCPVRIEPESEGTGSIHGRRKGMRLQLCLNGKAWEFAPSAFNPENRGRPGDDLRKAAQVDPLQKYVGIMLNII